jgi:hypothetical protein
VITLIVLGLVLIVMGALILLWAPQPQVLA